jgi:hypothetical protein
VQRFQSHLGSILPQFKRKLSVVHVASWFQSHLGSILPNVWYMTGDFDHIGTVVSIPPWFDFAG